MYFSRLRSDLKKTGRITIIDMKDDLTGILRLFATEGHWMSMKTLHAEMQAAGYQREDSFSYLPVQNFEVFSAASP